MTIEDVKITIRNHILNSISHFDLYTLCNHFKIPTNSHRNYIKKLLIDSIFVTTDVELLHRILIMINKSEAAVNNYQIISNQTHESIQNTNQTGNIFLMNDNDRSNSNSQLHNRLYCISNVNLQKSPIDLGSEILNGIDPKSIFIPCHTKYPVGYFQAPSMNPTLLNGRFNTPNVQLPYSIRSAAVATSPFYCCQVVLHPLSLLIPKPTPNINQTNRIMSKMQLQFTVSSHAKHLITAHSAQVNNRRIYKWQVLLRFGLYDPLNPFPNSNNCSNNDISTLPEYIPPYLILFVNNATVQLWDILPSNSTAKEGKRHPRPINITDYLKYSSSNTIVTAGVTGYRQFITVNWWQTPGVYQYYYFAIYLERKLSVNELNDRFVNRTHRIQMPISFTMDFIKDKFSKSNKCPKEIDDEDDLVISSVLPISLLCPVGKSRIICPIRSINCQHLQCFDAHLYLMMNERRSVWKCPVCDAQATLDELFVDEFFWDILQKFCHNDNITEVNVNPNGTFDAIVMKESKDHNVSQVVGNVTTVGTGDDNQSNGMKDEKQLVTDGFVTGQIIDDGSESDRHVILLESDDDVEETKDDVTKAKGLQTFESSKSTNSTTISNHTIEKVIDHNSASQTNSVTIDLTSDSEEEKTTKSINSISNPQTIIKQTSNSTDDSLSLHTFSHNNHLQLQALHHNMRFQTIAPKVMSNTFVKYSESSENPYQMPVNFSESVASISANTFQALNRTLSSTQNPNKLPGFMWMSQNSNRSNNLYGCYMPSIKPCFPAQNFVSMMHPISSSGYCPPSSMNAVNFGDGPANVLQRPIKSDPHANNSQVCYKKESRMTSNNKLSPVIGCTTRKMVERRKKHSSSGSSTAEASVKYRNLTNNNLNARRSSRLNRNKIIYKEKSISDESEEDLTNDSGSDDENSDSDKEDKDDYEEEEEDDDDDEEEEDDDDDDEEEEEEEEKIVSRRKRRNVLDDSNSSNSSKPKWKRLVFDQQTDDDRSNSEDVVVVNHHRRDMKADIVTSLSSSPIVMLNKLDPTILKVYLQQNETVENRPQNRHEMELPNPAVALAEDDNKHEDKGDNDDNKSGCGGGDGDAVVVAMATINNTCLS